MPGNVMGQGVCGCECIYTCKCKRTYHHEGDAGASTASERDDARRVIGLGQVPSLAPGSWLNIEHGAQA